MAKRLCLLLALTAATAAAQGVRLTWVGQACFYLETENGPTVAVDPPAATIGYALPRTTADVVTISHNHGDHNNSAGVRGSFPLVDGRPVTQRTEMTAAGLPFVLLPGFHDNMNGTLRGPNTITVWTQGGLRFAHFGDYGQDALSEVQAAELHNIDVMMVPAGGTLTIELPQAAALIAQVKPRVAILMHWRTALGGPATLAAFPAVTGPYPDIRYKPSTVALSRAALPATTEVWLMEPAAEAAVVNLAGATPGAPVAPGSLASVRGVFTGSETWSASTFPIPAKLGEIEVFLGNTALPLLYASPSQIDFQVPMQQEAGQNVLDVRVAGQRVARGTITTVARAPGLFIEIGADGSVGRGRRGDFITIYGSGQGAVTPAAPDSVYTSYDKISTTAELPVVTIGGRRIPVTFSGLTPGWIGLWQINAQIPDDAALGPDQDLLVWFDPNLKSNAIKVAVDDRALF